MNLATARGSLVCALAAVCLIGGSTIWQTSRDAHVAAPARYDYDEGVYAATADALAHGGRLYRDVFLSQPPVLIVLIRGVFALVGTSLAAARNTIVLTSALWLAAISTILWARGFPWGSVIAVGLLLGRASFLIQAHTVEMEVPSEALVCAAVAVAAWARRGPGPLWWIAAGGLAALAVMTKLTAATGALPLVAAAAERRATFTWRLAMIAVGVLLVAGALLPVVGSAGFPDQAFAFHIALARAHPESPSAHAVVVAQFLAGAWPLSVAAVLGLWASVRSGDWLERGLVAWLAADFAALVALTPLWQHHLIVLISPLALLAGAAIGRAAFWIGRTDRAARLAAGVALAAVAAYVVAGAASVPPAARSTDLARVVRLVTEAVPAQGGVLTDDPMVVFLARRRLAAGLVDTSVARIWAGEITEDRLASALGEEATDAVVLWRGTFREYFPRLQSAAGRRFPVVVDAGGGRLLLLRRPVALHAP